MPHSKVQTDAHDAQQVIETLIPDTASRTVCLNILADSIIQAHKSGVHAAVWAVTLSESKRFVRLNIGKIEVCAIFSGWLHLILDDDSLSAQNRDALTQQGAYYGGGPPQYANVPSSVSWDIPAADVAKAQPLFQPAYQQLIEKATITVGWRTSYYTHHTPGVLDYLRIALQRDIPDPSYDIGRIIQHVESVLATTSSGSEYRLLQDRLYKLYKLQKRLQRNQNIR